MVKYHAGTPVSREYRLGYCIRVLASILLCMDTSNTLNTLYLAANMTSDAMMRGHPVVSLLFHFPTYTNLLVAATRRNTKMWFIWSENEGFKTSYINQMGHRTNLQTRNEC